MKIFLLRHAQAENTFPDCDRALTKYGFKQIEKLAKHLNADIFDNLGEIWSSPFKRAIETKEHFCELLQLEAKFLIKENILPESDFKNLARELGSMPKSSKDILIVSHNFFLEELANLLISGERNNLSLEIKKASLTCLELSMPANARLEYGFWTLKASVYPKFLDC
ncbi:MAG: histidine phosphatase family protein [Opitutales bacterium]